MTRVFHKKKVTKQLNPVSRILGKIFETRLDPRTGKIKYIPIGKRED